MATFTYKARDRMGALVTGNIEAPNADIVSQQLADKGQFPVSIRSLDDLEKKEDRPDFMERFEKVKVQDLVLFTRQMSTLFNAGIPVLGIFVALEDQVGSPKFKRILKGVHRDIEGGLSLSEAMGKYPDAFSELYVAMIEAGEAGGVMDELLGRLADLLEKDADNDAKVKAAMRYPKMVVGAMTVAIGILMWKVVPVFVTMFEKAKIELPLATKILIATNVAFFDYWHYCLMVVVAVIVGFKKYISTEAGRYNWDNFQLKMPILGPIVLKSAMSKFARVFGALQSGGVPILDIITVTSRVVENVVIKGVIMDVRVSVQEGLGLAPPLKRSGIVPSLVTQMISAGEESGALDDMLIKVSDYYDEEVDRAVKNMSSMIEPILLVFMAALVLFLALAIFTPMWDMSKMATGK
ncbi:MAG: type II secretion system F family protein [Nitrospinae bacterium]|nr:type II secretion system F family protein [Nitrospinota bacterium]